MEYRMIESLETFGLGMGGALRLLVELGHDVAMVYQAERHNHALAEAYDDLGLANYEAIEAFERFSG